MHGYGSLHIEFNQVARKPRLTAVLLLVIVMGMSDVRNVLYRTRFGFTSLFDLESGSKLRHTVGLYLTEMSGKRYIVEF